jgi:hypothetical protein
MNKYRYLVLLPLFATNIVASNTWEDILAGSSVDKTIIDDGSEVTNSFYNSTLTYSINNNDGIDGNFEGTDTASITITNNGKVLSSGSLTSDQMKEWAETNSSDIINVVFNGDLIGSVSGMSSAISSVSESTSTLGTLSTLESSSSSLSSSSSTSLESSQSTDSSDNSDESSEKSSGVNSFSSQVMMSSETSTIVNNSQDGSATAGIAGFVRKLKNGNNWGMAFSYKFADMEDELSSKTKTLSILPFYTLNKYHNQIALPVTFNLALNVQYLESDVFKDGAGYLEYGFGTQVNPKYSINKKLYLKGTLGYNYLKKHIPSSFVPDDAKWLADAINSIPAAQIFNYGVGLNYDFSVDWNVQLNIQQNKIVNNSSVEDGRDAPIYYYASSKYDINDDWILRVGYKQVKNVKNYEEKTYMFSVNYNW